MIVFMFTCAVFGFLSAFPEVYWLFALFRLLAGMSIGKATVQFYLAMGELGEGGGGEEGGEGEAFRLIVTLTLRKM